MDSTSAQRRIPDLHEAPKSDACNLGPTRKRTHSSSFSFFSAVLNESTEIVRSHWIQKDINKVGNVRVGNGKKYLHKKFNSLLDKASWFCKMYNTFFFCRTVCRL